MAGELLDVSAVAALLGVGDRRVRALIASGQLPARQVLGRWAIPAAVAAEFRTRVPGRPLSQASAWAVLTRLAGTGQTAAALTPRLERRLRELPDRQDPVQTLCAWTARRAQTTRLWAAAQHVEALTGDSRVVLGGSAALGAADRQTTHVYADPETLEDLADRYGLHPEETADSTSVTVAGVNLAVVPRSPLGPRIVAAPVAAIDILDAGASKVAAQILESALGTATTALQSRSRAPDRQQTPRRPHPVPHSLETLRGPSAGLVKLPVTLNWGPKTEYDLAEYDDERALYRQVVQEATRREELDRYLRAERLVQLWPSLRLPRPIAIPWEERFPELGQIVALNDRKV